MRSPGVSCIGEYRCVSCDMKYIPKYGKDFIEAILENSAGERITVLDSHLRDDVGNDVLSYYRSGKYFVFWGNVYPNGSVFISSMISK